MISDPKFNTAKDWFEKLRDSLVETIHNIDENEFEITHWDHKDEGGGKMSKITGNIIEKGGVKDFENHPEKTLLEPWTKYSTNKYRGALSVRYKF